MSTINDTEIVNIEKKVTSERRRLRCLGNTNRGLVEMELETRPDSDG